MLTTNMRAPSNLQASVETGRIFWQEGRVLEGGRNALVSRSPDGTIADVNASPSNCRTRVHEYGGASYTLLDGGRSVAFSEFVGQHLQLCPAEGGGAGPKPLTTEAGGFRFADGRDDARGRLVIVRETESESPSAVVNEVVSVPHAAAAAGRGEAAVTEQEITVLATGRDFYSYPRLSSCGTKLAYVCWDHPNMPWDNTELFIQDLDAETGMPAGDPRRVTAGGQESVCQPLWAPDGSLLYLSDSTTGFYNLHVLDPPAAAPRCLLPQQTEFCSSHQGWQFGLPSFHLLTPDTLVCALSESGVSRLCTVDVSTGDVASLDVPGLPADVSEMAVVSPTKLALSDSWRARSSSSKK